MCICPYSSQPESKCLCSSLSQEKEAMVFFKTVWWLLQEASVFYEEAYLQTIVFWIILPPPLPLKANFSLAPSAGGAKTDTHRNFSTFFWSDLQKSCRTNKPSLLLMSYIGSSKSLSCFHVHCVKGNSILKELLWKAIVMLGINESLHK